MIRWLDKLVNCLELETVDLDLLDDIDDVLTWFVPSNSDTSYKSLELLYGQKVLNERFEEFLDRLIVGDLAAGEMFPVGLSEEHAKKRYRKLIRIFHPDRGVKSSAWLNYRAEKINKAHQQYLDNITSFDNAVLSNERPVKTKVDRKPESGSKAKFKYKPNVWRERLGSPKEFQRKALAALIIISALLVIITFFDSGQSFDVQSRGDLLPVADASNALKQEFESESSKEPVIAAYTLNSRAQEILQEADLLISQSNDLSDVSSEISSEVRLIEAVVSNEGGAMEGVSSSHGYGAEVAHDNSCYSENILKTKEIKQQTTLLIRLNVREGPSLECGVLVTFSPGAHLTLLAQTEDRKWTQVINSATSTKGWVDTGLLMVSPEPKKYELSETQVQKTKQARVTKKANAKVLVTKASAPLITKLEPNNVPEAEWVAPVYFKVVESLKKYYEVGDDNGIASLYMSSGRENEIRGIDKIRKYYRKAFKRTVDRKFKYSIESFRQDSESTAVVSGKLILSMSSKRSSSITDIDATYKIIMVKVGGEYKIAAFEWAAI